MRQDKVNKVLKDEELIENIRVFLTGVKKHGMTEVLRAIDFLDFNREEQETPFNKIIDVVCNNVEKETGTKKEHLKKELPGTKRHEYSTARNLSVLFLYKYGDLTYMQISRQLSRESRDFSYQIAKQFRTFDAHNKAPHVKLIGSLTIERFKIVYENIDSELKGHFKK